MTERSWDPGASGPGISHQLLLYPGFTFNAGRLSLEYGTGPVKYLPRFLSFESSGTVLLEDADGVVLPYTRYAGSILPISAVAIRETTSYAAPVTGLPTATTPGLILIGVR
ncbi:MAG: hypothetical protein B7Y12_02035 [Rhizobiales bacterium 24-66-13]|jgi:hypothetical protein|nr:MAG: hypothetical protein B7Z41_03885 [Rhizobiales bacterium 12-66-7]OYY88801.1 MAG: hypothetical protein B7Y61_01065 [Rhizobiales bacterium 35-66-30]OYZ82795.1 MAG: hypothetical protein B7Y12_02035 [Rhizobiales bacterium 24-66-13]OZB11828.1 MAG: hypothetical protein B7X67_02015 [Rhizobiales bacterium 39-66-18]HQS09499.1 hypothetical protein [Xanthobacteraceae bacterium]